MNLRLGFFPNFKGIDSVLLDGSISSVEDLASTLAVFTASEDQLLPIHSLATVAPHHPVQLFAVRSVPSAAGFNLPGFVWQFSAGESPAIQAKLHELARSASGHQYFNLAGSTAQLIISVGESGESWWRTHG